MSSLPLKQLPSLDEIRKERASRDTILEAMAGRFAAFFRPKSSWVAWSAFLGALFGLRLSAEQLSLYQRFTGRTKGPVKPFREAHIIVGRRGGKSRIIAFVAVFLACFRNYVPYLAPGERATVMVIAADRKQARAIFRYIIGLIAAVPMLSGMVEAKTQHSIDLNNRVTIEIQTASYRSTRSYTIAAALCDEIAFWRSDESANPDKEILKAIRPGMATIPGAMLIGLSSPYAQRGVLYEAYRDHFGKDESNVLVWMADTVSMHAGEDVETHVAQEFEKDPVAAMSEYGKDGVIQFRSDLESFLALGDLDKVTDVGVRERPYRESVKFYAFVDPSGGKSDSFTMAIAHPEGQTVVIDHLSEARSPLSPENVTDRFCKTLQDYRVDEVRGDYYGGEWPRERFAKNGIKYIPHDKTKSELYIAFLPRVTSGNGVRLLDEARSRNQFVQLERRVGRGGKESVDHPPGGHDDAANAVAGVVDVVVSKAKIGLTGSTSFGSANHHVPLRISGGAVTSRRPKW